MLLRAPVAQRPLVTWPASSSLSSESPVLQGPSWPQRPHGPSHGDLLDHALADVDVVPLDSDSCRLTTHVLVVLPVLQGSTGRVTVPGAAAPRGRSPARAEQPAFLGRGAQPRQPCLRNALRGRQPGQPWKHVHTLIWRLPPWDQANTITPAEKYLYLTSLPTVLLIIAQVRTLSVSTEGLGDRAPQEVGEDGPHLPSG